MERAAPYKNLEAQILKVRDELEQRYKNDLANEINLNTCAKSNKIDLQDYTS